MPLSRERIIYDLCGGTGSWSRPYAEAGYAVRIIDPLCGTGDVRPMLADDDRVHGVLAAPPCTDLSGSGARWWAGKGDEALLQALSVVDACLRIILLKNPKWWALESPVGRLSRWLGKPVWTFQPYEFGDPYTKRTCLWGRFTIPTKHPVVPTEGGKIWRMPPSPDRAKLRSITPSGFAQAFFEANP